MRWILVIAFCCVAVQAQAGAWPRSKGDIFVSLSGDVTGMQLYTEYGLRNDWTMGMEVTMPKNRRLPDVTQFLQRPIWKGEKAILSAGVAVELRETKAASKIPSLKGESEVAARLGLFWGRGVSLPLGDGWVTVDAQVEKLVTVDWLGSGLAYKLDAGGGVRPSERLMVTAQAQYWRSSAQDSLRFEGGLGLKMGRATVVLSPSFGLRGDKARRVKLGLWMEF